MVLPAVKKIVFADNDHVITVARILLERPSANGDRFLKSFFEPDPVDISFLREVGRGVRALDGVEIAQAEQGASLEDADVVVFRRGGITEAVIEKSPRLKLIQRLGSGSDRIDLAAAEKNGIGVSCLARKTLAHTAEHAILLMLALAKKLRHAEAMARKGDEGGASAAHGSVAYNWTRMTGLIGLHGRILGIVGLGEVGMLVASRARAFGMRVLYTKRRRLSPEQEKGLGVEYRPLQELLAQSHFVSVHAAGPENAKLIDQNALARMRPDAFLINTSRGLMVDEDALYVALTEGRIAGAGLDVRVSEPRPPSDRFCDLDNVVLTPHVSGGSHLDVLEEFNRMFDNIRAALAGAPLVHDVLLQPR